MIFTVKPITTHVLYIDWTLLWYYFFGDRSKYHVSIRDSKMEGVATKILGLANLIDLINSAETTENNVL